MIADASVLILFARAGHLGLLRDLFGSVRVPDAVAREVFAGPTTAPDAVAVVKALDDGWIKRCDVDGACVGRVAEAHPNLGLGEIACLCLAHESGEATILLDDAHARKVARVLEIRPVGCLGVVARAYRSGLLHDRRQVATVVRALLAAGLWVSADVVENFWQLLGGRPE